MVGREIAERTHRDQEGDDLEYIVGRLLVLRLVISFIYLIQKRDRGFEFEGRDAAFRARSKFTRTDSVVSKQKNSHWEITTTIISFPTTSLNASCIPLALLIGIFPLP